MSKEPTKFPKAADLFKEAMAELNQKPKRDDWNPHGFWNGKDNKLKSLVWKLDREIWAKVEGGMATQSWGRQESARLILDYNSNQYGLQVSKLVEARNQLAEKDKEIEMLKEGIDYQDKLIESLSDEEDGLDKENATLRELLGRCSDYVKMVKYCDNEQNGNEHSIFNISQQATADAILTSIDSVLNPKQEKI